MKSLFTKKAAIGVLLLASLTGSGYLVHKKWNFGIRQVNASVPQENPHKKGIVESVSFAKIDNELQACYESYLTRDPKADDGQMLFHLMIGEAGEINFLEMVHSDFEEDRFVQCVTDNIRLVRTPASADRVGVLIAHKFKFHRKDHSHLDF